MLVVVHGAKSHGFMGFNIMVPHPDSMIFYGLKSSQIPLKLIAAPENKPKKLPQKGSDLHGDFPIPIHFSGANLL